jgi:Mrp family chromosome partitioning ATPase
MRRGRGRPPVLSEIAGPAAGDPRAWSMRRADLESLSSLLEHLPGRRSVLLCGEEALAGSIALAAAAAAAGRRAALVECDLARPRLAVELGLASGPGLHEYLRWEASAEQILQPVVVAGPAAGATPHLACVVGGAPAADPATLLDLQSFRHAVAKLRRAYDLLVLSGPSLDGERTALEVAAARVDTVLVAVSPRRRSGRAGRELRAALRRLPIAMLGTLVVGAQAAAGQRS